MVTTLLIQTEKDEKQIGRGGRAPGERKLLTKAYDSATNADRDT
jgi:hypothetical protein